MPENTMANPIKLMRTPAPVIRSGAGDISERELSRERYNLQTTPPLRVQPAHPKRQLSAPAVSKFTARAKGQPAPQLARVRRCLAQYCTPPPARLRPKALSMEDLTPSKKANAERRIRPVPPASALPCTPRSGDARAQAAARVATFMVVTAWRRRGHDLRCLRRTLECQVSCSERLRVQVWTLRTLLDGDSAKLRLAMRELDRLKTLLAEKEAEKGLLDKEKAALERDVAAAQDHAAEMSIGLKSSRAEAEAARAATARIERVLATERAALQCTIAQRDHALDTVSLLEEQRSQQGAALSAARVDAAVLRQQLRRQAAARRWARRAWTPRCCASSCGGRPRVTAGGAAVAAGRGAERGARGRRGAAPAAAAAGRVSVAECLLVIVKVSLLEEQRSQQGAALGAARVDAAVLRQQLRRQAAARRWARRAWTPRCCASSCGGRPRRGAERGARGRRGAAPAAAAAGRVSVAECLLVIVKVSLLEEQRSQQGAALSAARVDAAVLRQQLRRQAAARRWARRAWTPRCCASSCGGRPRVTAGGAAVAAGRGAERGARGRRGAAPAAAAAGRVSVAECLLVIVKVSLLEEQRSQQGAALSAARVDATVLRQQLRRQAAARRWARRAWTPRCCASSCGGRPRVTAGGAAVAAGRGAERGARGRRGAAPAAAAAGRVSVAECLLVIVKVSLLEEQRSQQGAALSAARVDAAVLRQQLRRQAACHCWRSSGRSRARRWARRAWTPRCCASSCGGRPRVTAGGAAVAAGRGAERGARGRHGAAPAAAAAGRVSVAECLLVIVKVSLLEEQRSQQGAALSAARVDAAVLRQQLRRQAACHGWRSSGVTAGGAAVAAGRGAERGARGRRGAAPAAAAAGRVSVAECLLVIVKVSLLEEQRSQQGAALSAARVDAAVLRQQLRRQAACHCWRSSGRSRARRWARRAWTPRCCASSCGGRPRVTAGGAAVAAGRGAERGARGRHGAAPAAAAAGRVSVAECLLVIVKVSLLEEQRSQQGAALSAARVDAAVLRQQLRRQAA
ncbi:hypothetical protein ACJJTC_003257 [Scirpophaga incertulas]